MLAEHMVDLTGPHAYIYIHLCWPVSEPAFFVEHSVNDFVAFLLVWLQRKSDIRKSVQ